MTANPNRRLWRDLKLLRIAGTLPVAAIPLAIALMLTIIVLFDDQSGSETGFADLPLIYALAFIATMISGGIHLGLARIRGLATRRQCLVWGVLTSFLLEAGFFAIILGPSPAFWVPALQIAVVFGGLVFFPAGLLSGWAYWRLGIRQAPRSEMSAESPVSAPSSLDRAWERVFAGIMLAAVLTGTPMVASVTTDRDAHVLWRVIMVCLGSMAIWLIGGTAFAWMRRGRFHLYECLVLGLFLGFLLPAAAVATKALVQQAMSPEAPSVAMTFQGVGFPPLVRMGLIVMPFGLLSGWVFWRLTTPRSTAATTNAESPLLRRWRDLRTWRLVGALIVAAWVPATLFGSASILIVDSLPDEFFTVPAFGSALLIVTLWCLALGVIYLFGITRRRGQIRRRDCFLLGTLLFCLFPVFLVVMQLAFGVGAGWIRADAGFAEIGLTTIWLAFLFTPLGLLSGWIFWRVGVRPARPKDLAAAPVFD